MSTGKMLTISMESLNRLYFQFFQKIVNPHLISTIHEISQLLKQRSAYDAHRYLEDILKHSQNENNHSSNNATISIGSLHNSANSNSVGSINNPNSYSLPTNSQNIKNIYIDHSNPKPFEKTQQKVAEEGINFKNKLGMRRTLTGLPYEQPSIRPLEFKTHSDDQSFPTSTFTNQTANQFKIDYASPKQPLSFMPVLNHSIGKLDSIYQQTQSRKRLLKDIVRKIGKIFNDNHSKIQKYNKGTTQPNKLFNLNISTKLQKKQEGTRIKEYQFHTKSEFPVRKF